MSLFCCLFIVTGCCFNLDWLMFALVWIYCCFVECLLRSGLDLIVAVVTFLCCWLLWFCDSVVIVVWDIVFTAVLLFLVADCLCVVIW